MHIVIRKTRLCWSWAIQGAAHASTAAIQHVGINHGRLDILVTEQFLNGADAAHSYRDTMEQILWYLPKVREGGLVTGHDYGYPRAGYEVVAQAVDAAARFFRADLHVDKGSYFWWWRKGK